MTTQVQTYPAIYIIFTLLNAIRRGIERKNIWREFRRQGIALRPRLVFWVAICREMGLVKDFSSPNPSASRKTRLHITGYARTWLNKTTEEQMFNLIDSWQKAPKNYKLQLFRKKLLWKLKYVKPLTQKDQGALNGLNALGLIIDGHPTKYGEFFIKNDGGLPTPKAIEPCVIHEKHLIVPLPQHFDLLWSLEKFLRPKSPGVYPLTKHNLQFSNADPYALIELIERGLRKPMPEQTKALILKQPSIRIADGIVLEFSSPTDLKQLRRQPAFRKYLDEFLSPQRVLVSKEKVRELIEMLSRRGANVYRNEEQVQERRKRTHFTSQPNTISSPVGKDVSKLTIIENYKHLEQALDVLYRAPGYPTEKRRITPMFVEERGGHTYVIAYCQTRRAQRNFRLDRMEIPGTY